MIRVVLPAGKEQHQHDAPGEVTLLCLEGEVLIQAGAQSHTLREGDFLHLVPRIPHVLRALQDASLLVTICLVPG
ncbi:cupin domain-containing protein [Diaphorobacter sp.]|uniref:cupin domain-containing protein n=1 Tax=Diaphorobacter sp. TaxID=1934310 RepID=UPI0039171E2F